MFPGPVGGKDECCMDTEFPFGRIKKVLEMDGEEAFTASEFNTSPTQTWLK